MKKSRIIFFERYYPSANMILIKDRSPTLIDTGFGSDVQDTERLIKDADVSPEELHLIVNTHYHSDHVGGNSRSEEHTSELQSRGHLVCRLLLEKKKKKKHM